MQVMELSYWSLLSDLQQIHNKILQKLIVWQYVILSTKNISDQSTWLKIQSSTVSTLLKLQQTLKSLQILVS